MGGEKDNGIIIDRPTSKDALGITPYALSLAMLIRDVFNNTDKQGAFAIGITGGWGSWKSTVLKLIEKSFEAITLRIHENEKVKLWSEFSKKTSLRWKFHWLRKLGKDLWKWEPNVQFITINPWEYRWTDDFLSILMTEIEKDFNRRIKSKWYYQFKWRLKTFWVSMVTLSAYFAFDKEIIELIRKIFETFPGIEEGIIKLTLGTWLASIVTPYLAGFFNKDYSFLSDAIEINKKIRDKIGRPWFNSGASPYTKQTIRDEIQALLSNYTAHHQLAIIIDDLDRCDNDMIIETFSAIRLFLWKSNCVIIVAYDDDIVNTAISWVYKTKAHEYLDKIFNIVIPIGLPNEKQVENLLDPYQSENDISNHENIFLMELLRQKERIGWMDSDYLGKWLHKVPVKTPRKLIKIQNSFRFFADYHRLLEHFGSASDLDSNSLLMVTMIRSCLPSSLIVPYINDTGAYSLLLKACENHDVWFFDDRWFSQEEIGILMYALWKKRPGPLNTLQGFISYFSPRRLHSENVLRFYDLLYKERFIAEAENIERENESLEGFLSKNSENKSELIENQLCYFKGITYFPGWIEIRNQTFERIKKTNPQGFLRIMGFYIKHLETYALINRWTNRPNLKSAIKFVNSLLWSKGFGAFKSPYPLARYLAVLGEYENQFNNDRRQAEDGEQIDLRNLIDCHIENLSKMTATDFETIVTYLWKRSHSGDSIIDAIREKCQFHRLKTKILKRAFCSENLFWKRNPVMIEDIENGFQKLITR